MKRKDPPGQAGRFPNGFVPRKMCSYMETAGYCQKGDACTFAHSAEELASARGGMAIQADMFQAFGAPSAGSRFKPGFVPRKMCTYMASHGFCQKGESCTFAHSLAELQGLSATASQWDGMPGTAQVMGMAGMPQAMGMAGTQQHMGMAGMAGVPQPMAMSAIPQPPSDQDLLGTPVQQPADLGMEAKTELGAASRFQNGFAPRKMCTYMAYQGTCDKGDACTFAHSASELQGGQMEAGGSLAGPRKFENNFRPAILCRMWVQHPTYCKEGDACTFAHGLLEMAGSPNTHMDRLTAAGVFGLRAAYFTDPQGLAISSGVPSMGKGQGQSFQPMQSLPYNPYAQGKGSGKQDFAPFGSVRSFQEGLQPTELCSHWLKSPELCQNGDLCPFAHGVPELRPDMAEQQRELVSRFLHTGFKPKVMCKNLAHGSCFKGLLCTFAHSQSEIQ